MLFSIHLLTNQSLTSSYIIFSKIPIRQNRRFYRSYSFNIFSPYCRVLSNRIFAQLS